MLLFCVIIFLMSLLANITIVEIRNKAISNAIWVLLVTEKFEI